jgi:ELWxxDGT repeat protein
LLKDINPGIEQSVGSYFGGAFLKISDSVCLFYGNDGDTNHGGELWRTDGTTQNTKLVKDITPGSSSSSINFTDDYLNHYLLNGKLFFTVDSIWGARFTLDNGWN